MKIDLDQIRELLSVVSSTDVTELTIEFGDQRITVKKSSPIPLTEAQLSPKPIVIKTEDLPVVQTREMVSPATAPAVAPAPAAVDSKPVADAPVEKTNGLVEITSPMVGTFYRASSPEAPPFVDVGDHVNEGQTVCIIEAMKLMNDMPSEVSGKIVKVIAENGSTVEYGQTLFLVDPRG